jgi:hypothetical protein
MATRENMLLTFLCMLKIIWDQFGKQQHLTSSKCGRLQIFVQVWSLELATRG